MKKTIRVALAAVMITLAGTPAYSQARPCGTNGMPSCDTQNVPGYGFGGWYTFTYWFVYATVAIAHYL